MLLNHTDVVPVQREFWDEDPFGGQVIDGFIWGRGALDMKGLGIAELMTFITLKRLSLPLARDVVFFAQADEEAGSEFGMRFIEREYPETLDAEYVINEGGGGSTESLVENGPCTASPSRRKARSGYGLWPKAAQGHGSMPHEDNALNRLVRAMYRVQEWERPMTVSPVLTESVRAASGRAFTRAKPPRRLSKPPPKKTRVSERC